MSTHFIIGAVIAGIAITILLWSIIAAALWDGESNESIGQAAGKAVTIIILAYAIIGGIILMLI